MPVVFAHILRRGFQAILKIATFAPVRVDCLQDSTSKRLTVLHAVAEPIQMT
jgi:hypothetical protein